MRRLAVGIFICVLVLASLSCGGGTFFFASTGNGVSFFSVSGTVSIVNLTTTSDGFVTVVTLTSSGTANTITFCGNAVNSFPTNAFVTVNFTHNGFCEKMLHVR